MSRTPPPSRGPDERARTASRLRGLSRLLDSSIPLPGGFRIGLDGLIGLIPGLGDTAGAALSGYIILNAARLGAPTTTLFRMVVNVLVEAVIGTVPVIGDLFDFAWKANERNMRLLEPHLDTPAPSSSAERRLMRVAVIFLILMLLAIIALSYLAIRVLAWLIGAIGGA